MNNQQIESGASLAKYDAAIAELIQKNSLVLTPGEIAPLLGSTAQTIRETAKKNPERIGFPFTFCGKLMVIPKKPFLDFLGV